MKVTIFDILGREITELVNEVKDIGTYTIIFSAKGGSASGGDAINLSSGVYICTMAVNDYKASTKLILAK